MNPKCFIASGSYNVTVKYKGSVTYCVTANSEAEAEQKAEELFSDGADSHTPVSDFEVATGFVARLFRRHGKMGGIAQ